MFKVTKVVHAGGGVFLYRAVRDADSRAVVIKALDPRQGNTRDIERLKHEYELGSTLDVAAVAKPLELVTYEGMPALVMEDFDGESLDHLLGAPMEVGQFLPLAVHIAEAVAEIHRQHVIHKDLKPQNILVSPASGVVKIAGLGIATRLPREHRAAQPPRLIEGSLPYMSPEQTGRMNRAIDSRSDLYSLGVTFYELLTGRLPFEARDPLEWVHCHVAHAPQPPSALVPALPEVLSTLVLKLLAKMAEDRYQTARGLQHDLERCLAEWRASGRLEPFALAQHDIPDRIQIPEKLYGRDEEVAALLRAVERVACTGAPELILVSGYSGIGKSVLVHELHEPVVREHGFFIAGKFDRYKRGVPYSTIVRAFHELVLEILAESDERIAAWRQRLLDALGTSAQLIIDVIPQVELVTGRQPPVAELPPAEAQNRFRTVFRRFIAVFARKQHPLTLFLDDLQWIDVASLELLTDLLMHPETRDLLVIGAYRSNEVGPSHPLMRALEKMRKEGASVSDIVLGPLSREHLTWLITDMLRCSRDDAQPLASLVHDKTAGNPFFTIQFLTALHDEQLIYFDSGAGAFRWDMAKISAKSFTDNVVELMVGKLERLPASTREAMKQLACLGNTAEAATLEMAYGRSIEETHADLWEAIRAGLVLRLNGTYKFLHDRVQEATYSLIPEGERTAMHLEIGRRLASRTPPGELEEKIFEIVNQLDRGAALIVSRQERERAAELNLVAGKRAKAATAYASALVYFTAGAAFLEEDGWQQRYELTFALEFHLAECEFLSGDLAAAEARLSMLARRARNLVDLAAVTCVRLPLYTTLDRSDRAIEVCLEYLRRVGIQWSPHPTDEEVRQEYERMWRLLGSRPIEQLIDLPPMTDPDHRATIDVLTHGQSPALFTDENLLRLVIGRMVNISLEHGSSDASCLAYVYLGMVLGPYVGDYRTGFRFGKLGFDLLQRRELLRFKARGFVVFGHRVSPWSQHLRIGVELLRRAFDVAQETGDLTYAAYARNCLITLRLARGDPLGDVQRDAEDALAFVEKARFGLIVDIVTGQLRLIRTLRGLTPDFSSFDEADFDEGRFEQHLEGDPRLAIAACWYWIRKLQARFHAGDYASAVAAAAKAERLLWTSRSFFEVAEYHFYGALARAALHDAAAAGERAQHLTALAAHLAQLEVWAESCPENFADRAALVAAESARIGGDREQAARLYEQAIRSAGDNGFVHDEGLACELAARFYEEQGFHRIADTYLRDARTCYVRWGAGGKVGQLDELHPRVRGVEPLAPTAAFAARAEHLDLLAVIKASQAISGEIVKDQLLRTLFQVVLEQSGASRACLLLARNGELCIEAEAKLDEHGRHVEFFVSQPAELSRLVPISVVQYVRRTKERVILHDASVDAGRFSADELITTRRPRSLLCLPPLSQADMFGLLYLENNLIPGAFTPERLVALELLAAQAAISFENAQLLAKEQAARQAAEAAERRATFLAAAGEIVGGSLEYGRALRGLVELSVQWLADWCVIDVIEDGQIRRLAGKHTDPAKQRLLEELEARYPPRPDSAHPASRVMRSREALLMAEMDEATLRSFCADEEHYRLVCALGTRSVIAVPLVTRGELLGVISLVSGRPEHHYGPADLDMARELARRAAMAIDNTRLYREAQNAVRLRDEFLAVASHELRTPIASLMLALQAMLDPEMTGGPPDPEATRMLARRALRQSERLSNLVGDLLAVSRIDTGGLPLKLGEMELGEMVREVVGRFELDLGRSRCPVTIHASAPVMGCWDRARLEQVVSHLLSNAIKFGAGKPIDIVVDEASGVARLRVQDQGAGIDPAQQEHIFERFGRAVSVRHYGGLGLGLYVSRRIVEAHGGSIRVESRPGAGAIFTVELPRARAPAAGEEQRAIREPLEGG
jgi:predicted ATPase/signal transduction histidine kinase